ncbi:MAG: helix-turn-helix domain-containing protein [Roseburia sp. 1XD42-69]|nr:helix-turn-helix domain-containing protein [Roseburia sp. 1XD42-69]
MENVCDILNIGKNWAYRLLTEQKIQAFKIWRNWKFPRLR